MRTLNELRALAEKVPEHNQNKLFTAGEMRLVFNKFLGFMELIAKKLDEEGL